MASVSYVEEGSRIQGMKAAVFSKWGGPLTIANVAAPTEVADTEVIVAVKSVSINSGDWRIRHGVGWFLYSRQFPKTAGRDFSGIITKIGSKVEHLKVGDEVFGTTGHYVGTFTEYIRFSASSIAKKPKNQNWHEAASVPVVGFTAYDGIVNYAKVSLGQKVLILGAGSAVGILAVQLAKIAGATVWATCSAEKADLIKSLGADFIIDYKTQDLIQAMKGAKMDVVYDAVGARVDRDKSFYVVKPYGKVITANPADMAATLKFTEIVSLVTDIIWKKISNYWTNGVSYLIVRLDDRQFQEMLIKMAQLIEEGKLKTVIDSVFPFQQIEQAMKKKVKVEKSQEK